MKILDKIFGSDQQLTRPDFDGARTLNFDLGGNKVSLHKGRHTAGTPIFENIFSLDVFAQDKMERSKSGKCARKIYSRSWSFCGRGKEVRGRMILSMVLHYFPDDIFSNFNLYNAGGIKQKVVNSSVAFYGMFDPKDSRHSLFYALNQQFFQP